MLNDNSYFALINTLRSRQNDRHFPEDVFKWIFLNENEKMSIKISLNFVPKRPINNIAAGVQIMASRRPGDKSLSEPTVVSLLTHICVTRPQRVNELMCGEVVWSWTSRPRRLAMQNVMSWVPFYWHRITEIRAWMSNFIHSFTWAVIPHPILTSTLV